MALPDIFFLAVPIKSDKPAERSPKGCGHANNEASLSKAGQNGRGNPEGKGKINDSLWAKKQRGRKKIDIVERRRLAGRAIRFKTDVAQEDQQKRGKGRGISLRQQKRIKR